MDFFFAEWYIVFLWSCDDRTMRFKHMRVHERLQQGAKVLKTVWKEVRGVQTKEELIMSLSSVLDCIWANFVEEQSRYGYECMKHLCHKCRTKFKGKLLSCKNCGVRYCSSSCQSEDWKAHKLVCRSPSANNIAQMKKNIFFGGSVAKSREGGI